MKFTPGGDDFPSPCRFCGHVRYGEGVCKCDVTCPTCYEHGCCGQIIVPALPKVT